jgi:putative MATE family efflux protein
MVFDGWIISSFLGTNAMAAFGISNPFIMLLLALTMIFANGGTILISHYTGRGDWDKISQCFTTTILSALLVTIIISLTYPFYVTPLAIVLGAKGTLIQLTSDYMSGLLLGAVPLIISQVLLYIIRLDGSPKLALASIFSMTVVNIILDFVFVVILGYGIFSVGLATSISYVVAIIVISPHLFSKGNSLRITRDITLKEALNILKTGLPSSLNRIYITMRGFVTNNLAIIFGGTMAMSTLSIQGNINLVLSSMVMGIGMTTTLLSGLFYGEKDKRSLRDTLAVSFKVGLTIITIVSAIFIIFSPMLVSIFTNDPAVLSTATFSLRLLALAMPPSLICVILLYFYSSTENKYYANYMGFAHSFLFTTIFALVLTPLIGPNGIWVCFVLGEVFALIGFVILIKIKEKKWPKSIEDILLLNDNFGEDIIGNLSISLENNIDEVIGLSNEILKFGEKYKYNKEIFNKLALCVEEMAGNIIKHGFEPSTKHYVDIRITLTEKNIIFRIRDDGKAFNPVEYANQNKISENAIGIHMIQKLSKKMDYINVIGLNNLTITL